MAPKKRKITKPSTTVGTKARRTSRKSTNTPEVNPTPDVDKAKQMGNINSSPTCDLDNDICSNMPHQPDTLLPAPIPTEGSDDATMALARASERHYWPDPYPSSAD